MYVLLKINNYLSVKVGICMLALAACLFPVSQGSSATTEYNHRKTVSYEINVGAYKYWQSEGHYLYPSLDHLRTTAEISGMFINPSQSGGLVQYFLMRKDAVDAEPTLGLPQRSSSGRTLAAQVASEVAWCWSSGASLLPTKCHERE